MPAAQRCCLAEGIIEGGDQTNCQRKKRPQQNCPQTDFFSGLFLFNASQPILIGCGLLIFGHFCSLNKISDPKRAIIDCLIITEAMFLTTKYKKMRKD